MKSEVQNLESTPRFSKAGMLEEEKSVLEAYIEFETSDILVVRMRFRPFEKLLEERHSPHEKVICLNGKIHYKIQESEYILRKNDNIDINSNKLHSCQADKDGAEIIVILSKNQYFESFFER